MHVNKVVKLLLIFDIIISHQKMNASIKYCFSQIFNEIPGDLINEPD
jgi:hypothetical protein